MIKIEKKINENYDTSSLALVQRERYIKLLSNIYQMKELFLSEFNNKQELTHIVPFYVVKDQFIRKRMVSMPFDGCYGGPISLNGQPVSLAVWQHLIDLAKESNISSIEIRIRNSNDPILQEAGFREYSNLICSELDLESMDNMWKKLTKGHKWSINKFRKMNYQLSTDSSYKDLKQFYHIMSKNMRSYGTPMYPFSYFKTMWEEYQDQGNVKLVKCLDGNRLIGAAFLLFNGDIAIYKYCSVIPSYIKDCVYHGIVWQVIQESIARNCKVLNMGTSFTDDTGLIYFKSAFGSQNFTVSSYLYQEKKRTYHTVNEIRSSYSALISLWRYIPLPLTELLSIFFWRNFC